MTVFQPRWRQTKYSDVTGVRQDPERERQPLLDWYMERYASWRSLYDGTALEEKLSTMPDLGTASTQDEYRYPVRFNLVRSFCLLYAGLLWGRGNTGKQADKLFDLRVESWIPGRPGPEPRAQAKSLEDTLSYFWSYWFHILRPHGTVQQWAGGSSIKVHYDPASPSSVMGIQLQMVQPEHFYPVWNPLNFEELIAVKIKFRVPLAVAVENYGLSLAQAKEYAQGDGINVEEHWDRNFYYVRLGKGKKGADDMGVPARIRRGGAWLKCEGKNTYINPITGTGVIPFVYVPRLRDGQFFGDSLAYSLEGINRELNKTLADFGDALTRGTHPAFGISDFHGTARKDGIAKQAVIQIPRSGALNMGTTAPGGTPPKVHEFPAPSVPPQTPEFMSTLLSLSEVVTGLTPAARGASTSSQRSGFAMAMELLPTTTVIDWERAHWTTAIAKKQGLNEIISAIWLANKGQDWTPPITETAFLMPQHVEYRPVVPRDRAEIIDEVVRLATAQAVSPQEWLKRLGDIDDLDEEFVKLMTYLTWWAQVQAAVAGRAIKVKGEVNPEEPSRALPEVAGQTEEPKSKQPAKQPEGQKTTSDKD